jgi:predicted amidophosphoribosyltransferase
MTWIRLCFRGFNQSKLLAQQSGFKPVVKLLKRNRFKKSLTTMTKEERLAAMKDNFTALKFNPDYASKNCIIVDDVLTTGATIHAAAEAIKKVYPNMKITAVTFAMTPKYFN